MDPPHRRIAHRRVGALVTRSRGLMLCLFGIAVLAVVTALAYRTPAPRISAPADTFSAYRAQAELKSLLGDGAPHPLGSDANARVRQTIVERLAALGFDTEIQSGFICNEQAICGKPANIVARRAVHGAGDALDQDFILLAAHYDSVPAGPGAADDAAGVASVLEIARILTLRPTRRPIAILLSDGEEAGLLGALLFVRDHPLAKRISAAVNLEARGSSGPSLMFETGSANAWLMGLYRRAIARPITDSVYYVAYKFLPNNTDFSVFKAAGWQGFNFAFIGNVGLYHTAQDRFDHVDLRSIQHQGDNALASLLALANGADPSAQPAADAVYFDVLSRALLTWPAGCSLPAAGVILVLLSIEAALLWRARRVAMRQMLWGALGALGCVLLAGLASGAALLLLVEFGKVPPLNRYSWIAHPAWMDMACAALAAAAAGLSSHFLARRAGFWGFWLGANGLLGVLSVLQAAVLPSMSFISLIAVAAAVIAVLPALRSAQHTWRTDLAALAPAWIMFALMIPLVSLLYGAIGSPAWIIDALLFGLGATLLLPLLAAASKLLRRRLFAVAAAAGMLGIMMTFVLPTYSAAWPQRLDFRYLLDANRRQAVWLAEPDSLQLPEYLSRAALFGRELHPEFLDARNQAFEAPAPCSDLAAPLLTLRSAQALSAATTRYNVHLQSLRGAAEIDVAFSADAHVHDLIFSEGSGERRVALYETENRMTRLHLVGLSSQGVDFAVEVRGGSLEAHVFDQSYTFLGGEFLERLRPPEATSSQEGDTTIVQNIVTLEPAAGR